MPEDDRFHSIGHPSPTVRRKEERPYRECPRCSEYRFREVVKERFERESSLWNLLRPNTKGEWVRIDRAERCRYCHYEEHPATGSQD